MAVILASFFLKPTMTPREPFTSILDGCCMSRFLSSMTWAPICHKQPNFS